LKRSQNPLVVLLEDEEEKQQVGTELGHSDQTIQVGRDAHKFRAVTTAGGGGSVRRFPVVH
jgi:hypothetical protein